MKTVNKTLLRTILLMFLPVLAVGQAAGQDIMKYGFVGKSQTVLYNCELGYAEVTLGDIREATASAYSDAQYFWEVVDSPVGSEVDFFHTLYRTNPQITINLYSDNGFGNFVFCCTRTSKYGYQKEYVTVWMKNSIEVIATPKRGCWAHGESITIDQFDIYTNPRDMNYCLVLDTDSRTAVNHIWGMYDTQEVHFVSSDPSRFPVEENRTVINVLRNESVAEINVGGSIKDIVKVIKHGSDVAEKLKKLENALAPIKKIIPGIVIDPDITPNVGTDFGVECCQGGETKYVDFSGGISAGISFEVGAPIPTIPCIHWFVGMDLSFGVDLAGVKWTYDKQCRDCDCGGTEMLEFSFGAELYGGLILAAIDPNIMSVSGVVTGGINWGGGFFFPDKYSKDQNIFSMDKKIHVYGKVEFKAQLLMFEWKDGFVFAEN